MNGYWCVRCYRPLDMATYLAGRHEPVVTQWGQLCQACYDRQEEARSHE